MKTLNEKEVAREIAKELVAQFSPDDLELFDELIELDPNKPAPTSTDRPLAYGLFESVPVLLTPAFYEVGLLVVRICNDAAHAVGNSIKEQLVGELVDRAKAITSKFISKPAVQVERVDPELRGLIVQSISKTLRKAGVPDDRRVVVLEKIADAI